MSEKSDPLSYIPPFVPPPSDEPSNHHSPPSAEPDVSTLPAHHRKHDRLDKNSSIALAVLVFIILCLVTLFTFRKIRSRRRRLALERQIDEIEDGMERRVSMLGMVGGGTGMTGTTNRSGSWGAGGGESRSWAGRRSTSTIAPDTPSMASSSRQSTMVDSSIRGASKQNNSIRGSRLDSVAEAPMSELNDRLTVLQEKRWWGSVAATGDARKADKVAGSSGGRRQSVVRQQGSGSSVEAGVKLVDGRALCPHCGDGWTRVDWRKSFAMMRQSEGNGNGKEAMAVQPLQPAVTRDMEHAVDREKRWSKDLYKAEGVDARDWVGTLNWR